MNIFYLDKDPKKCAEYHCDQHCVKMIIEYAQIMSTVQRSLDGNDDRFYKSTHKNHPCVLWTDKSAENYKYLYQLFCALCDEFQKRYGKTHLTDKKMRRALKTPPHNIPNIPFTKPALAMPDDCKTNNAVESYRNYYIKYKSSFATWKNETPKWFKV